VKPRRSVPAMRPRMRVRRYRTYLAQNLPSPEAVNQRQRLLVPALLLSYRTLSDVIEEQAVRCPKCSNELTVKNYGRLISVNRCGGCAGLFVMPDALAEMKDEWMSEMLDSGNATEGRKLDAVRDIDCPSCSTRMEHKTDDKQTHIGYEQCPGCGGVFFDAGEFTDWKQDTVGDFFKGLRARFRSS